jgi:ketosteroid isomerase-like protein
MTAIQELSWKAPSPAWSCGRLKPAKSKERQMSALDVVNAYYEACNNGGDLSRVPLASDVKFTGPLASVEGAAEFRAHTAERGDMKCSIREQFVSGNRVCSIVDWTMRTQVSSLTTTEILEVRNGEIVSGEVIFDPERVRNAIARNRQRT